ncbi:MAG: hypothetical protein ACTSWR_01720 [Candidatus Helarchaeota archaeon]
MRIFEVGIIRNEAVVFLDEYYNGKRNEHEIQDKEIFRGALINLAKREIEYTDELKSFEIFNYHVSMIGKKNGNKSKFIFYLISDVNLDLNMKKNKLNQIISEFFKSFPPPRCYNPNTEIFNKFLDNTNKIVGDLGIDAPDRLIHAWGINHQKR